METANDGTPRSPPQQEPDPKRPKMSSTTATSDDDQANTANPRKPRYKRRKIAIFFAYCGVGYQGMQKNPGAKTIEGDLEEALFHAGAVPEPDRGNPKRYDWARSARTDKGVSAVGQVVSGRFYVDPPGLVGRLNSLLPEQIRIFGYKRVTASFNSKKFCDRRRYVYLIPVFALDPSCHRDRESVLASVGSGSELVKCVECSERGRKVVGLMGKRCFSDSKGSADARNGNGNVDSSESVVTGNEVHEVTDVRPGNDINEASDINVDADLNSGPLEGPDGVTEEKGTTEPNARVIEEVTVSSEVEKTGFTEEATSAENARPELGSGTIAIEEKRENGVAEAEPETVKGIEFVKCEVVGQSFMLHQIRKMMGLAVAIMRNCAPESLFEKAFEKNYPDLRSHNNDQNVVENSGNQTKHIDIDYHFVRKRFLRKRRFISFIGSDDQLTDCLTKGLSSSHFADIRSKLHVKDFPLSLRGSNRGNNDL
ncbi:hypothetical protein CRG98_024459 [Punica granatum]|uniref:Pseudouridine synthase I TruA alpha/beta domain-containing protein n=1 Tax=Punica granatum TaxID=22663 RepID=A0A2I0JFZ8_PUNGR|nr:hypothetical protein CRG98_024459 [Punica granatum]